MSDRSFRESHTQPAITHAAENLMKFIASARLYACRRPTWSCCHWHGVPRTSPCGADPFSSGWAIQSEQAGVVFAKIAIVCTRSKGAVRIAATDGPEIFQLSDARIWQLPATIAGGYLPVRSEHRPAFVFPGQAVARLCSETLGPVVLPASEKKGTKQHHVHPVPSACENTDTSTRPDSSAGAASMQSWSLCITGLNYTHAYCHNTASL